MESISRIKLALHGYCHYIPHIRKSQQEPKMERICLYSLQVKHTMIQLHENEHIILLLHKHWFVMVRTALGIVSLVALLAVVLPLLPLLTGRLDPDLASAAMGLGIAAYLMMILLFAFFSWMDYYLDMWIVTEKRIIDVDQRGLFSREVSEIPMASVQDVTVEVHGIIQTMLGFGTIRIQTAGEREFTIDEIPHLGPVKDAILNYAHQQFATTQKISNTPDA